MASKSPDDVKGLSKKALEELIASAQAELQARNPVNQELVEDFYEALCAATRRTKTDWQYSLRQFAYARPKQYAKLVELSENVLAWAESLAGERFSRMQRHAFFQLSCRVVITIIHKRELPLTTTTILTHMDYLPAYFNQSFPGYASGKMLPLIMSMMQASSDTGRPDYE